MDLIGSGLPGIITQDDENQEDIGLTLEEFEEMKGDCERVISYGDAAVRLAENPDFKLLVMDGYFKGEPDRLAGTIASGKFPPASDQNAFEAIKAIGKFAAFFQDITAKANIARDQLEGLEEARDMAIKEAEELSQE